ncbi:MAG: hypothetical protein NTZ14_16110 [Hyphomicrobiales bacterium]|nr:hypothetical protein [Hyphomicrobiales bacterium]
MTAISMLFDHRIQTTVTKVMPHLLHACGRMVSSVIDSDVVNFSVMQVAKAVEGPMDTGRQRQQ